MLKASKHEANLKIRSPLGSLQTTTSIGGRCTGGDVLSRAVLITRKLSWREPRCKAAAGGKDTGMREIAARVFPGGSEKWSREVFLRSVPPMVFLVITAGAQANARYGLKKVK